MSILHSFMGYSDIDWLIDVVSMFSCNGWIVLIESESANIVHGASESPFGHMWWHSITSNIITWHEAEGLINDECVLPLKNHSFPFNSLARAHQNASLFVAVELKSHRNTLGFISLARSRHLRAFQFTQDNGGRPKLLCSAMRLDTESP